MKVLVFGWSLLCLCVLSIVLSLGVIWGVRLGKQDVWYALHEEVKQNEGGVLLLEEGHDPPSSMFHVYIKYPWMKGGR